MAKSTIQKLYSLFQKFINTHKDLINAYEIVDPTTSFEYYQDEIIDLYINALKIDKNLEFYDYLEEGIQNSIKYNINIIEGLGRCTIGVPRDNTVNITQQYFKDINKIYTKNNNNYDIEYSPNNRDKLIEMNLKTVISIAKKYRGLGLSLNELISAGNLGLVYAYDKFDPARSTLKDDTLKALEEAPDTMTYENICATLNNCFQYGGLKKKFSEKFTKGQTYSKNSVRKWINANICNAKFNSVAVMWIKAYILIEIDNNSRIVKKPKSEIYKDKNIYGVYKKEVTLDIDAPISEDSDTPVVDIFTIDEENHSELEVAEAYETYKKGLSLLLDGVKKRDKNIFLKRFGIGLPRPMLPKEIADQEGLSIARISQIFRTVISQMQKNQVKYDIDPDIMFDAVRKIK